MKYFHIEYPYRFHIFLALMCLCSFTDFFVQSVNAQNSSEYSTARNFTAGVRQIEFAGVTWTVKLGFGGPGPNNWSDSEESVWLDAAGRLHMKVREINGVWYSAEVYTNNITDYGEHRFLIEGQIDDMDKNAVLGLFVYADDLNEVDIEYSKWGTAGRLSVGGFTVQPYTTPGNTTSFFSALDTTLSTQFFNWQPDSIVFGSIQGLHEGNPPSEEQYIYRWTYTGNDIPNRLRNLRTRINLWMFRGASPVDTTNLEVIIADVIQPLAVTSVEKAPDIQPETFAIQQNYPNPFNPQTTIDYSVQLEGEVELRIYNVFGKEVRTLVRRNQQKGTYSVVWDGKDELGQQVASGTYFYRIKAANNQSVRKMLLLR